MTSEEDRSVIWSTVEVNGCSLVIPCQIYQLNEAVYVLAHLLESGGFQPSNLQYMFDEKRKVLKIM